MSDDQDPRGLRGVAYYMRERDNAEAENARLRAELAATREREDRWMERHRYASFQLAVANGERDTARAELAAERKVARKLREALVKASDDLDDALQHSDVDSEKVVDVRNAIDALLAATKEDIE